MRARNILKLARSSTSESAFVVPGLLQGKDPHLATVFVPEGKRKGRKRRGWNGNERLRMLISMRQLPAAIIAANDLVRYFDFSTARGWRRDGRRDERREDVSRRAYVSKLKFTQAKVLTLLYVMKKCRPCARNLALYVRKYFRPSHSAFSLLRTLIT